MPCMYGHHDIDALLDDAWIHSVRTKEPGICVHMLTSLQLVTAPQAICEVPTLALRRHASAAESGLVTPSHWSLLVCHMEWRAGELRAVERCFSSRLPLSP